MNMVRRGVRGQTNRFTSPAVAVSLIASLAALTGCSAGANTSGLTDPDVTWQGGQVTDQEEQGTSAGGIRNIARWTLPLDEFTQEYSNLDNYAEQLLLSACLSEGGINWPVPWQDVEQPLSPVVNDAGRRLFNSEIAEEYGFRPNLALTESDKLWEGFLAYRPAEPGFQAAFDECLVGIREEYPALEPEEMMLVTGLIYQVSEEAFLSAEVQEAAGRWRSCMEPQGFGQLPKRPDDFPSPELLAELGAVGQSANVEPSERELQVARAHAACLDSSGYSAAMYEKEWELQEVAIERDRANLDRIRAQVHEREVAVQKIIAANAPKA
ncbi:hypothetical protein [Microbacterium aurantiacum]|uniref:Uncharacterized protein n=1 Tax=Microbacterium aurantiacum TaxID=162393 RepID=A0A0N0RR73_9MICO|nr:hypothetical protein [Microbacterium chocolatum]ANG86394.1 hypothetical protein A8L33_14440 [Microbacterium chocolatum]KOS09679.1 hypothetical protein XI38_14595 [Microbacterium chocolatum]